MKPAEAARAIASDLSAAGTPVADEIARAFGMYADALDLPDVPDAEPNAERDAALAAMGCGPLGPDGGLDLKPIIDKWQAQCGSHDLGLPTACRCPDGDPRIVIGKLIAEIERLRAAQKPANAS